MTSINGPQHWSKVAKAVKHDVSKWSVALVEVTQVVKNDVSRRPAALVEGHTRSQKLTSESGP